MDVWAIAMMLYNMWMYRYDALNYVDTQYSLF